MQVQIERSGGFAGVRISRAIRSEELAPEEERELRQLVEAAGFFELPEVIRSSTAKPDDFEYRVSVELDNRSHSIQVDDSAVPARLRPLLNLLITAGRKH